VRQRRAQQLAADAVAARFARDDRAHESGRQGAWPAHEPDAALDATVTRLGDQQVLLGLDAVALELREEIALRLPERIQHEVALAARAGARERGQGAGVFGAEGADRHRRPPQRHYTERCGRFRNAAGALTRESGLS